MLFRSDQVADDGYYAVKGFYDNAGTGNTAIIVNVGQGTQEVSSITCVADVSDSLRGTYFQIGSAYDRVRYYVWFTTNGIGTNPSAANPGLVGVKVSIATGSSASVVASAVAAALIATGDFTASASAAVVTATAAMGGPVTDPAAGTSGFTMSVTTQGARPLATDYIGDASLGDRKSTRLNSSHTDISRMPSSA